MHIKKGDNVKVIAGKDKGKEGKVVATEPKKDRVVVVKKFVSLKNLAKKSKLIINN